MFDLEEPKMKKWVKNSIRILERIMKKKNAFFSEKEGETRWRFQRSWGQKGRFKRVWKNLLSRGEPF